MFNFSQYQSSGNKAIDLCANVIGCARKNNQAVKALHLQKTYYEWFKSGVCVFLGRELMKDEKMQFDGVEIEMGSKIQTKPIIIEYYPKNGDA